MLTLALDTTTRSGSTALVRDGAVIDQAPGDPSRSHAERLPLELMAILKRHALGLRDIDLYAVAIGPGSFTGVRIGIATMQGLAFAENKPLIGVSGCDALAHLRQHDRRVATWVDAWRGEVYAALYEGGREIMPPIVGAPGAILRTLATLSPGAVLFVGDGADTYRDLIFSALGDMARMADPVTPAIAGAIGMLAAAAAAEGDCPPPHAIRPLYVRRPDAELARGRTHGSRD